MDQDLKIYEEKMEKTVESLKRDYAVIRAGRANPAVLDRITVEYYGSNTPINQVATISVPEARILQIQPWDRKLVKPIEKAINRSDLGINPNSDGMSIRLIFPELTEERRKELAKDIKKKGEGAKVALRNIRREANDRIKKMEKDGEYTEDDVRESQNDIQKLTEKYSGRIDREVESKTKEIMTV